MYYNLFYVNCKINYFTSIVNLANQMKCDRSCQRRKKGIKNCRKKKHDVIYESPRVYTIRLVNWWNWICFNTNMYIKRECFNEASIAIHNNNDLVYTSCDINFVIIEIRYSS